MNEQKILLTLSGINLWWKGEEVPERIKKSENHRKVFFDIVNNCLSNEEILSISGPRQVGKTTLMGQAIEHQIQEGIDPKRIIYIPLDNEFLDLNSDNILQDSLQIFFDHIVSESPENLSSKVYIYLDEVQSLERWAKQLKSYYDSYKKIKFIISGSSQTKLQADASESLVGRIQFRVLLSLKFKEFLEYHIKKESQGLQFSTVSLREALEKSLEKSDPKILYNTLIRLEANISQEIPQIKKLLTRYLIKGGYPGLLLFNEDYDRALEKIKTDLELVVYKDIYQIFNTRNSSDLMSLLTLLANSTGQKLNYSNLGSILGIDRRVVAKYIHYLKLVYLIDESPIYKSNITKKIEKAGKVYLKDVGQRNALLGRMNKELLDKSEMGLVIQTVVYNHATRLKFQLSKFTDFEVCYWEDGKEVDIVIDTRTNLIPIEVKSNNGQDGIKSVYDFIDKHKKSQWGMIVTMSETKLEKNVLMLPLWAFLLMC